MDKNSKITVDEIFNLALKNHQENKIEDAQGLYNQVLKINPMHQSALNNLGTIFQNSNDYIKALNYFEKAIEINPGL